MLPFDPLSALQIAGEAAQKALEFRGNTSPEVKADNTLVTHADRELEEFLRERLGELAPDFSFLGEESGLAGDPLAPAWVIDPIDGTTNFVRDIPMWCISVGAVHQGKSIFGVVVVPQLNDVYWAASGMGAWRSRGAGTTRLQVQDSAEVMQEDLIACNTTVERVVDFRRVPCRLRNFGSLAYHFAAMARGSLFATLAHEHKLYDIAAGMCLCQEAGCVARYLNGREWTADVTAPREPAPLLVAPPLTLDLLMERLQFS